VYDDRKKTKSTYCIHLSVQVNRYKAASFEIVNVSDLSAAISNLFTLIDCLCLTAPAPSTKNSSAPRIVVDRLGSFISVVFLWTLVLNTF